MSVIKESVSRLTSVERVSLEATRLRLDGRSGISANPLSISKDDPTMIMDLRAK